YQPVQNRRRGEQGRAYRRAGYDHPQPHRRGIRTHAHEVEGLVRLIPPANESAQNCERKHLHGRGHSLTRHCERSEAISGGVRNDLRDCRVAYPLLATARESGSTLKSPQFCVGILSPCEVIRFPRREVPRVSKAPKPALAKAERSRADSPPAKIEN